MGIGVTVVVRMVESEAWWWSVRGDGGLNWRESLDLGSKGGVIVSGVMVLIVESSLG